MSPLHMLRLLNFHEGADLSMPARRASSKMGRQRIETQFKAADSRANKLTWHVGLLLNGYDKPQRLGNMHI